MRGSRFNYEATKVCKVCNASRLVSLFTGDVCELCQPTQLTLPLGVVPVESTPPGDPFSRVKCEHCGRWVNQRIEPYCAGRCEACWWPEARQQFMKQWREFK